jgi:hypothetical protein
MTLSLTQLHILQHSLGLDSHGQPPEHYRGGHDDDFPGCYRNNFYAAPGHSDWPDLLALADLGYMKQGGSRVEQGSCYFSVLEPGYAAVKDQSPPPPKLTRGKRRWQQYVNWKDAWHGSFPEFLAWMKAHGQPLV